jgi:hypothetical protein
MRYYTYWSILDSPNSTSSSSVSLVIFIISFCLFVSILKFKKKDFEKKFYLSIVSLFLIISFLGYVYLKFFLNDNAQNEKRLNTILNSNRVQIVEGEISNYTRTVVYARNGNDTNESFNVDSINFKYIENTLYEFNHFGGNHSKTFHDGLKVKITYIKGSKTNEIQKIEIAENQ